jgi:hypothetical protein
MIKQFKASIQSLHSRPAFASTGFVLIFCVISFYRSPLLSLDRRCVVKQTCDKRVNSIRLLCALHEHSQLAILALRAPGGARKCPARRVRALLIALS